MDSAPRTSEPAPAFELGHAVAERFRPRTSTLTRPPRTMLGAGSLARSATDFGSLVGLSSTHRWALLRGYEHDDRASLAADQTVRPPAVEWPWEDDEWAAERLRATTTSVSAGGERAQPPADFDPSIHRPARRSRRDGTPTVFGDRRVDALLQAVKASTGGAPGGASGPATSGAAAQLGTRGAGPAGRGLSAGTSAPGTSGARRPSGPVRRGLPLVARRAPMGPDMPRNRPGVIAAAVQPEVAPVDPDSPVLASGAGTPTRRPGVPGDVGSRERAARPRASEGRRPGRGLNDLHRVLVEQGLIGPGADTAEATQPRASTTASRGASVPATAGERPGPTGRAPGAQPSSGSALGSHPTSGTTLATAPPATAAAPADALPMAVLGRTPAPSPAVMALAHRAHVEGSTSWATSATATAASSATGVAVLERGAGQLQRRARGAGVDWVPNQVTVPDLPAPATVPALASTSTSTSAPASASTSTSTSASASASASASIMPPKSSNALASPPTTRSAVGAPGIAARPGGLFSGASVMSPMSHRPLLSSMPTALPATPPTATTLRAAGATATDATAQGATATGAVSAAEHAAVRPPDAGPAAPGARHEPPAPGATAVPADPVERFRQHLELAPAPRTHELPRYFRPLATALVGDRPVRVASDTTSRTALQAAGKVAATVGDTIHVARPLRHDRADAALVAHELTHVAHPSPEPRFFDDDRKTDEEQLAEQMAAQVASTMWQRPNAPALGSARGAATPTLGTQRRRGAGTSRSPAPSPADRADDVKQVMERAPVLPVATAASGQSPAPPAPSASGGAMSASSLAAALTGSGGGGRGGAASTPAPPRPSTPAPSSPSSPSSSSSSSSSSPSSSSSSASAPSSASSTTSSDGPSSTSRELADFERLLELLEERVLAEIERRGGRFRGGF